MPGAATQTNRIATRAFQCRGTPPVRRHPSRQSCAIPPEAYLQASVARPVTLVGSGDERLELGWEVEAAGENEAGSAKNRGGRLK
jgi:hypothetical protein